ncbi:MAG: HAMP domain-containing protein [Nostocales cyanobacterium]|nr:MAG: HAMP domain-containing protein [Nostocales cyanobacterium]TAF13371.1 MAG: HAMP domain-containing protein [Nostocales cyanobacterium]
MINQVRQSIRYIAVWINYIRNDWSIAQKITYGYTLIISIAAIGTISGLLIANFYEKTAQRQLFLSYQQQALLKDLKNVTTTVRIHPQRLVNVLDDSVWLAFERNRFLSDINQVNEKLDEVESFIKENPDDLAVNYPEFTAIVEKYKQTNQAYNQTIQGFWRQIELNQLRNMTKEEHQRELIKLLNEINYINQNLSFEKLSDELIIIIGRAEIQRNQANFSFRNAQELRIKIILFSIILSYIMAILLAFYTTRLIIHPLEEVTNTAEKITKDSNFTLRSNVQSNDEVGVLSVSLNRLVDWVESYTNQLELARETLEQKVEERTQELQQAQRTLEQRVKERTKELQETLQTLKNTQGQLIQTEKMSSLGEMVAGIAHEINNPVNFIYGNIQCAENYFQDLIDLLYVYKQQYPEKNQIIDNKIADIDLEFIIEDISKLMFSMKLGSQRIREIVLSLRNFSRLDEAEMKDVDIHEGIDNTLLILNHRLKQEIDIIKNYGNLPVIDCYPAQLNQVFMNIISNAIDALTECKDKDNKQILINTSKVNHESIKVSIRDNAMGIPEDQINKLFDPFYTTKPVGKGTGLGLSICYQIIEKHQGKIEVVSVLGEGTEFIIYLPIKYTFNDKK